MHPLARLDQRYVWHPFTQMRDWLRREPAVIVRGRGAVIEDVHGKRYLDANSSIWTNLHGHNHPVLKRAITRQLNRIAHSSALGLASEPASLLAEQLIKASRLPTPPRSAFRNPRLKRVFFSDDGSTAVEVALKLAYEYARRSGLSRKPRFLSLQGGYHGDTVGAVSLGHIDLFHKTWSGMLFRTDSVMSPYCYRCPFNRAKPERADARGYRVCHWECVDKIEQACSRQQRRGDPHAGFVFEPVMQGAAGMIPQPQGWLRRAAEVVRGHGTLLIADEVMTGFGRVEGGSSLTAGPGCRGRPTRRIDRRPSRPTVLASHLEGVQPDLAALAKGLTGGMLPMAATLTSQPIFDVFLGEYEEFRTFFHGHSYTGNQLGAAAALANLELLARETTVRARRRVEDALRESFPVLWARPNVGDIRQEGCVAGIELVADWRSRRPFALDQRVGTRVCEAMARRGVLTRPIGNVVVLMPPFRTTPGQVRRIVEALDVSIREVLS